ncbi:MAG: restriction endonuclease subunit S [Deltaproteobacteria bacterium]|nr:restriction endonuclease subunit S [Deltaproteobacteria bacterium]
MGGKWNSVTVEEIAAATQNALATGPFGSSISAKFFTDSGTPVIRGSNLSDNIGVRLIDDGLVYVENELAEKFRRSQAVKGDLVFTCWGTVNQVGIIDNRSRYGVYIVSNKQMKFTPDNTKADSLYLYYYFSSPDGQHQILSQAIGSSVPGFNLGQLRAIRFPLPPLAEQKAIAHLLGTLDDKIENNRRMNATLEAMARAIFKSWFVDFDPVRAKAEGRQPDGMDAATAALFPDRFTDSPLGKIPAGWGVIPLYETADYKNGAAFRNEDFTQEGMGLPVIKIAELKEGITAQTKWSFREAIPEQVIDTGDLLYSWSGSPETSLDVFLWENGPGLLNQHIFKVIAPTPQVKRLVYYLLKHLRPVLVETAKNKQTTGLGHVTVADMKRLLVCWPPDTVKIAFDKLSAPLFEKAFANQIESRKLAATRDALLPKLLSGEVRVGEAAGAVERAEVG